METHVLLETWWGDLTGIEVCECSEYFTKLAFYEEMLSKSLRGIHIATVAATGLQ